MQHERDKIHVISLCQLLSGIDRVALRWMSLRWLQLGHASAETSPNGGKIAFAARTARKHSCSPVD